MLVVLLGIGSSLTVYAGASAALRLSGVVPLTGEVQVSTKPNGQLHVKSLGVNNLKVKKLQKRQIASFEKPVSVVILEAP